MLARTHLAFGLLVGLIALRFFNVNPYLFIPLVLFGALFPDIDHPKSKLGRKIKPLSFFIKIFIGHRTLFHSLLIPLVLFIIYYILGYVYILAFLIGFISHLAIDALTKSGINFLYPFAKLKVRGFIETGKLLEHVFLILLIGVIVVRLL